MPHPLGPVLLIFRLDAGDEVLIAGEDDDQHQIGDHHHVDEGEDTDDHIPARAGEDQGHEAKEFLGKFHQEQSHGQDQPEVEGRQQPAAVEEHPFQQEFDGFHEQTPKKGGGC